MKPEDPSKAGTAAALISHLACARARRTGPDAAAWEEQVGDVAVSELTQHAPSHAARAVRPQSETEAALTHVHFRAEGDVEFRALLYIPAKAPYNFMNDYYGSRASLKLYVRRVFISDDFEELIPRSIS
jgi:HSP90 family molecular chaperone